MTKSIRRTLYIGLMAILAVSYVIAQSDREFAVAAAGDKYVISAKAGGVNYVEGPVSVIRNEGRSGYLLRRDEIAIGDKVSTGSNAKAEILLNPGSYMRVGPDSSFAFKSTALDDLEVDIISGSAIFEVFAANEFKVRVNTPESGITFVESGIFRIDVLADGSAKAQVWSGKAVLDDEKTKLKKGREVVIDDGNYAVAKFDRGDRDEFETWSKARGKLLAKQSSKLKNDAMEAALVNSFMGNGWNTYDSFGLWVFDRTFGSYCFLPFGSGWRSPYGFGFGNCLCNYNLPARVYYVPVRSGGTTATNTTVTPEPRGGGGVPPFVRIQGNGGSPVRGDSGFGKGGFENGNTPPIFAPAPMPAPMPMPSTPSKGSVKSNGKDN